MVSFFSSLCTASALVSIVLAAPTLIPTTTTATDPTVPYRSGFTGASPSHTPLVRPSLDRLLSTSALDALNYAYKHPVTGLLVPVKSNSLHSELAVLDPLLRILPVAKRAEALSPRAITTTGTTTTCLSGTATDVTINTLLHYGGAGTIVYLCPSAVINITSYIFFWNSSQTIATLGYPTDNTRAMIRIVEGHALPNGTEQTNAVYTAYSGTDNCALRNIQIDGARQTLGMGNEPFALVEMGGSTTGHLVDNCHIFEPRGWSALHLNEGSWAGSPLKPMCRSMVVTNNQVGPSGHAPSGSAQFKRDTGSYSPGQWADGISTACLNTLISGNTVTDATDGAIVIFASENVTVTGNTIVSRNRVTMGGINLVDFGPMLLSFVGVVVSNNNFLTDGPQSLIKVGVPIGPMVWSTLFLNSTWWVHGGAQVINNKFTSTNGGYFGYGVAVGSVIDFNVSGNTHVGAVFSGVKSQSCFPQMPNPQAFTYSTFNTGPGTTLQSDFLPTNYTSLLICVAPNATS